MSKHQKHTVDYILNLFHLILDWRKYSKQIHASLKPFLWGTGKISRLLARIKMTVVSDHNQSYYSLLPTQCKSINEHPKANWQKELLKIKNRRKFITTNDGSYSKSMPWMKQMEYCLLIDTWVTLHLLHLELLSKNMFWLLKYNQLELSGMRILIWEKPIVSLNSICFHNWEKVKQLFFLKPDFLINSS